VLIQARTPGLLIRAAEPEDSARLVAVERDSPVPAGRGLTFSIDRVDALALSRMQPESVVLAAELDGEVVGMHSASLHEGLIGGHRKRLAWVHYPRVHPTHRGKWIGHALQAEILALIGPRIDHWYQIFAPGRDTEDGRHRWRTHSVWMLLDAGRIGGPRHGRPATPDDAELVVEMINASHAHDELFLPRTAESLTARMERAPTQYSWRDLLIGDGAVVGVWRGGWRVIRNHHNHVFVGLQDNILDYGFLPGAEGELLRLLRAVCGPAGRTAAEGYVGMWTSVGSTAYPSLTALAGLQWPYELHSDIPEPATTGRRGVHLDALHST
jgi:GNAT superfamily N-acetyltransferase